MLVDGKVRKGQGVRRLQTANFLLLTSRLFWHGNTRSHCHSKRSCCSPSAAAMSAAFALPQLLLLLLLVSRALAPLAQSLVH